MYSVTGLHLQIHTFSVAHPLPLFLSCLTIKILRRKHFHVSLWIVVCMFVPASGLVLSVQIHSHFVYHSCSCVTLLVCVLETFLFVHTYMNGVHSSLHFLLQFWGYVVLCPWFGGWKSGFSVLETYRLVDNYLHVWFLSPSHADLKTKEIKWLEHCIRYGD